MTDAMQSELFKKLTLQYAPHEVLLAIASGSVVGIDEKKYKITQVNGEVVFTPNQGVGDDYTN